MQIPVISGIYTDSASDFRTSYPRNLVPVPKGTGISEGYLRPADGIVEFGVGPGVDRGGINWRGVCYRVMGSKLVKVISSGEVRIIGDVGGVNEKVNFDYSFERLAIASNNDLFLYDGTDLIQVTDPDLGNVLDVIWVDGYFMTTDGEFLVVTELNDPTKVDPLKYGSSEANPDDIKGILKIRNEVYACNRHTIEVFDNVGSAGFPFQRIEGAQIEKGTIGSNSFVEFQDTVAFLGSDINEAPAIYQGSNGRTVKISSREIDQILLQYSEKQLENVVLENKVDKGHDHLWVRLPDQTLVYDGAASLELKTPVWFILTSSLIGNSVYRAQNLVWCYNQWLVGDPLTNKIGVLTDSISSHYGQLNGWDFSTSIIYNEGRGGIFHELELVSLTGRSKLGDNSTVWTQYSIDGEYFSIEKPAQTGKRGDRSTRLSWLQQGHMRNWRVQKFRGTSDAHISIARLEARIEALND